MIKARSKKISMLLILAMMMTLFVGVGTASAATDNVALTIPEVGTSGSGVTLGTLKITESDATVGSIDGGQQVTINLPKGVSYDTAPTTGSAIGNYVDVAGLVPAGLTAAIVAGSSKSLTIGITGAHPGTANASLSFLFNAAGVSTVTLDGPDEEIAVEIYAPNSGITQGNVIVARSTSAGTTTTVMEEKTVAVGTNKTVGTIRIAETRSNGVKTGDSIKIVAPSDITIVSAAADISAANWTVASETVGQNGDGYSQWTIKVNPTAAGATPGFLNLVLKVDVDDRDFNGPIDFTVKGDNVTTQKITVGKVADYNIEVEAKGDPKTVKAGFAGQGLQDLTIKENLAGSFVNNRDFVLELPSYAHWQTVPTITVEKGNGAFAADQTVAGTTLDNQRHKLTFTYTALAGAAPTKTEFTFEDLKIFVDADAPEGDLTVTADGRALGGDFEVVLGKVVKPVTASADATDVKIGLANQKASDITITEAAAGMLKYEVTTVDDDYDKTALTVAAGTLTNNVKSKLVLDLPDGVKFSNKPTVEVTEGDLKLKDYDVKLANNGNQLEIPISKTSSEASTIVVSDIEYTLDRTVPEAEVYVQITGTAVDCIEPNDEAVVKVANATTVTPAPGDYKNEVSFVIGASSYTVNGVEQAMDVAPYIKNSRTYMPIRYVAYALGIDDNNILWDGVNRTVTLMKGDKVVQLQIGSNNILINGAAVTMDVAPEITSDRTMLPARWVAQAFGASVGWDEATQTVTIN